MFNNACESLQIVVLDSSLQIDHIISQQFKNAVDHNYQQGYSKLQRLVATILVMVSNTSLYFGTRCISYHYNRNASLLQTQLAQTNLSHVVIIRCIYSNIHIANALRWKERSKKKQDATLRELHSVQHNCNTNGRG